MASLAESLGSCSRQIYQEWFDCVDADGDGRIVGDEAKKFFAMSQIENHQLREVWKIADSKCQGFLGFKEFISAMQVLSLVQEGIELNENFLKRTFDVELVRLPVMKGLDSLLLEHRCSRINERNVSTSTQLGTLAMSSLKRCLSSKLRKKADKITSKADGLKKLYNEKLKPLEIASQYDVFASPLLANGEFDAKPMVLLLGQYSTGKTTFIERLLKCNYPGAQIGSMPTTNKFVVIMDGPDEIRVDGHISAVHENMHFKGLATFGKSFLSNFECSRMSHPLLERITIVDAPGVLAGEKQPRNISYDYIGVIKWFAERCDLIFLMFDPHTIIINDEFKEVVMSSLRGQDSKIRVILNKANEVGVGELIQVCSGLTWSLGRLLNMTNAMHVYTGSFNRDPVNYLFKKEEDDLLLELDNIPKRASENQIRKFLERAKSAKLHAYIINQLMKEMPAIGMMGKAKAREKLVKKLDRIFEKVQRKYHITAWDFPNVEHFRRVLRTYDIHKFKKLKPKLIQPVDDIVESDIPALLKEFKNPYDQDSAY